MSTFNEILVAAQTLKPDEKMRLVEAIWNDVPPSDWPPPSDECRGAAKISRLR